MKRSSRIIFVVLVLAAIVHMAQAQMPYRGYAPPAGSTLPYQLEYFRPQSGYLDQYNQFVAPREQLSTQLNAMARQQNYDFQAVQKQFNEADRIRDSKAAPTGTAAGFMNYSHYFGGRSTTAARPNQQQRRPLANPAATYGGGMMGGMGMGYGT